MHAPNQTPSVDTVVRRTIEEVTGNALADIQPDADLTEDLGISKAELLKIIKRLEISLEIELSNEAKREILEDAEQVSDVIDVVAEEYEF